MFYGENAMTNMDKKVSFFAVCVCVCVLCGGVLG